MSLGKGWKEFAIANDLEIDKFFTNGVNLKISNSYA